MTLTKNSKEAREFMKKVREAKAKKATPLLQEDTRPQTGAKLPRTQSKSSQTNDTLQIDLPENKFMLLLNLIMSIQDDIDYLMSILH